MLYKKILTVVLLSYSWLSWSMTEQEFNDTVDSIRSSLNIADDYLTNSNDGIVWLCDESIWSVEHGSGYTQSQKTLLVQQFNNIKSYAQTASSYIARSQSDLNTLTYGAVTNTFGGGSCSWTTNDVFTLLTDFASVVSYLQSLNDALFDDPDSIADVVSSILTTEVSNSSTLNSMLTELTRIKNYSQSQLQKLTSINDFMVNINGKVDNIEIYFYDLYNEMFGWSINLGLMVDFLGAISYDLSVVKSDVSLIATNTTSIVYSLDSLTNRFYYSSRMGYDRFRYYGKPMAGSEIQLTNLAPYDNVNNLRSATIYDIIASGFSSSLIAFGSINNYLHYLESAVVSNNDSRIVAHLGAISNLVHRVDDYVLNDFSNEFHTLAVEIDSWYQGGASNQNHIAISNQFYLSVITQQIDSVSALLQTNNFLISEFTIITNEVGQISTNISWLVDNIRSLELPVTAEFRGDQDTYYDFLTNYYLNGTANDNPSSNWFERVEVLLAALVFSGNSTTNISDTLSDSSSLSQQVETLINTIDFSQDSSNTIGLSRNVQQSYINFFHSLRNTITSKSNTSTFVLGWGDKDTVTFNDLTSGNFRISISTTEGVFGTFTNIFRSVTTMVWVLFTLFCIYKMGFWLCSRIYSLYSIVRSLIFSLWGK